MSNDILWKLSKVYDWLVDKLKKYVSRAKNQLRPYYRKLRNRIRSTIRRLREKWQESWKPVVKYGGFTLAPYVLAYGVLLNIVTGYFLGFRFTVWSVTAHGLGWYFLKEELTEIAESLRPTVKADVKVRDR